MERARYQSAKPLAPLHTVEEVLKDRSPLVDPWKSPFRKRGQQHTRLMRSPHAPSGRVALPAVPHTSPGRVEQAASQGHMSPDSVRPPASLLSAADLKQLEGSDSEREAGKPCSSADNSVERTTTYGHNSAAEAAGRLELPAKGLDSSPSSPTSPIFSGFAGLAKGGHLLRTAAGASSVLAQSAPPAAKIRDLASKPQGGLRGQGETHSAPITPSAGVLPGGGDPPLLRGAGGGKKGPLASLLAKAPPLAKPAKLSAVAPGARAGGNGDDAQAKEAARQAGGAAARPASPQHRASPTCNAAGDLATPGADSLSYLVSPLSDLAVSLSALSSQQLQSLPAFISNANALNYNAAASKNSPKNLLEPLTNANRPAPKLDGANRETGSDPTGDADGAELSDDQKFIGQLIAQAKLFLHEIDRLKGVVRTLEADVDVNHASAAAHKTAQLSYAGELEKQEDKVKSLTAERALLEAQLSSAQRPGKLALRKRKSVSQFPLERILNELPQAQPLEAVSPPVGETRLLSANWPEELSTFPDCPAEELPADVPNMFGEKSFLWRGLKVRIGINTGYPLCQRDPCSGRMDYLGPVVNKTARIESQAYGGMIACSEEVVSKYLSENTAARTSKKLHLDFPCDPNISQHTVVRLKGIKGDTRIMRLTPPQLIARLAVFDRYLEDKERQASAGDPRAPGDSAGRKSIVDSDAQLPSPPPPTGDVTVVIVKVAKLSEMKCILSPADWTALSERYATFLSAVCDGIHEEHYKVPSEQMDTVMIVFQKPSAAMSFAMVLQEELANDRTVVPTEIEEQYPKMFERSEWDGAVVMSGLKVQVGLHVCKDAQPTVDAFANAVVYIGHELQHASTLASAARGGQVVFSREVYHSPGVSEYLLLNKHLLGYVGVISVTAAPTTASAGVEIRQLELYQAIPSSVASRVYVLMGFSDNHASRRSAEFRMFKSSLLSEAHNEGIETDFGNDSPASCPEDTPRRPPAAPAAVCLADHPLFADPYGAESFGELDTAALLKSLEGVRGASKPVRFVPEGIAALLSSILDLRRKRASGGKRRWCRGLKKVELLESVLFETHDAFAKADDQGGALEKPGLLEGADDRERDPPISSSTTTPRRASDGPALPLAPKTDRSGLLPSSLHARKSDPSAPPTGPPKGRRVSINASPVSPDRAPEPGSPPPPPPPPPPPAAPPRFGLSDDTRAFLLKEPVFTVTEGLLLAASLLGDGEQHSQRGGAGKRGGARPTVCEVGTMTESGAVERTASFKGKRAGKAPEKEGSAEDLSSAVLHRVVRVFCAATKRLLDESATTSQEDEVVQRWAHVALSHTQHLRPTKVPSPEDLIAHAGEPQTIRRGSVNKITRLRKQSDPDNERNTSPVRGSHSHKPSKHPVSTTSTPRHSIDHGTEVDTLPADPLLRPPHGGSGDAEARRLNKSKSELTEPQLLDVGALRATASLHMAGGGLGLRDDERDAPMNHTWTQSPRSVKSATPMQGSFSPDGVKDPATAAACGAAAHGRDSLVFGPSGCLSPSSDDRSTPLTSPTGPPKESSPFDAQPAKSPGTNTSGGVTPGVSPAYPSSYTSPQDPSLSKPGASPGSAAPQLLDGQKQRAASATPTDTPQEQDPLNETTQSAGTSSTVSNPADAPPNVKPESASCSSKQQPAAAHAGGKPAPAKLPPKVQYASPTSHPAPSLRGRRGSAAGLASPDGSPNGRPGTSPTRRKSAGGRKKGGGRANQLRDSYGSPKRCKAEPPGEKDEPAPIAASDRKVSIPSLAAAYASPTHVGSAEEPHKTADLSPAQSFFSHPGIFGSDVGSVASSPTNSRHNSPPRKDSGRGERLVPTGSVSACAFSALRSGKGKYSLRRPAEAGLRKILDSFRALEKEERHGTNYLHKTSAIAHLALLLEFLRQSKRAKREAASPLTRRGSGYHAGVRRTSSAVLKGVFERLSEKRRDHSPPRERKKSDGGVPSETPPPPPPPPPAAAAQAAAPAHAAGNLSPTLTGAGLGASGSWFSTAASPVVRYNARSTGVHSPTTDKRAGFSKSLTRHETDGRIVLQRSNSPSADFEDGGGGGVSKTHTSFHRRKDVSRLQVSASHGTSLSLSRRSDGLSDKSFDKSDAGSPRGGGLDTTQSSLIDLGEPTGGPGGPTPRLRQILKKCGMGALAASRFNTVMQNGKRRGSDFTTTHCETDSDD
eukprot:gene19962-30709_t